MDDLLSVIIPAYNEERRLGDTLKQVSDFLRPRGQSFEIIVVDDGSDDATSQVASRWVQEPSQKSRVLRHSPNRGKGFSVRRGMLDARGRYALLTDADLSAPIEELAKLEEALLRDRADIALGSRDVEGSSVEIRQSRFRETGGKAFNRLMRIATGLPFRDTQCGFKLFDLKTCRQVFERQRLEGFGFDVEVLYIASKRGLRLREVPVVWRNAEGSKVGLDSALRAVADLLTIRRNDRAGLYDD